MSKMRALNTLMFHRRILFFVFLHHKFRNYFRELWYCAQKFLILQK